MALALCPLLLVVGPSPERMLHGLSRVLNEGLAQELRAKVSPSDPATFPAPLDDGRDA